MITIDYTADKLPVFVMVAQAHGCFFVHMVLVVVVS